MRILLVQDMVWIPSFGGANKMNRLLLEGLARLGNTCHAIVAGHGAQASFGQEEFAKELRDRGITFEDMVDSRSFSYNGVSVSAMRTRRDADPCISRILEEFAPDWVLVASEDPGQRLLSIALKNTSRVVYLARTTLALPFGPSCALASESKTHLLRQVQGVVVVSRFLQDYFERWAGIKTSIVPISPSGDGPFMDLSSFDSGYVTMINPCSVKGLSIFKGVAEALPQIEFAAVPTWGTTASDLSDLLTYSNVTVLPASDDIVEIIRKTRILLFPSLWAEAHGMTIIEAMLHGIPVIASALGGIAEAKQGLDYLIPVNPILRFTEEFDDRMLPVPLIPQQNLDPWIAAIVELTSDRNAYGALSKKSRTVTLAAQKKENVCIFADYLTGMSTAASGGY
jgi:glycosyltransferase involved in cell wall biosynthesis